MNQKCNADFCWLPDYQDIMACEKEEPLLPEVLQQEENHYWKEIEYLISQLPAVVRQIWEACEKALDQYEYKDSCIYVEYVDFQTISQIADKIAEELRKSEKKDEDLSAIIRIILCWNVDGRRQRYWRRSRVFE